MAQVYMASDPRKGVTFEMRLFLNFAATMHIDSADDIL